MRGKQVLVTTSRLNKEACRCPFDSFASPFCFEHKVAISLTSNPLSSPLRCCAKTQLISIPIQIHSRIFLTRHAVRLSIVSHISKDGKALDWSKTYKCSWRSQKWSQEKKQTKNKISPKYLADLMFAVFEEYQLQNSLIFFLSCFHLHWCIVFD